MGTVRVTKELREQVQSEILSALSTYGKRADFVAIRARHSQIAKSTFYFWVKRAEASGIPQQRALQAVQAAVASDVVKLGSVEAVVEQDAGKVVALVPRGPRASDLIGLNIVEISELLRRCRKIAEEVEAYARTADGKIRSPKMLMLAAEHLRRLVETAARVQQQLFDEQAMDDLHRAIFKVLATRDKDVVRLILDEIDSLLHPSPYRAPLAKYA